MLRRCGRQGRAFISLSVGNPVILPEVEQLWRNCTAELLASAEYGEVVCRYGASQGYQPLIEAVVEDFNRRYGLALTERNVLITPGSQALYFLAANALGGQTRDGRLKHIVLPLSPDYTGYGGVSLTPGAVRAYQPRLDIDAAATALSTAQTSANWRSTKLLALCCFLVRLTPQGMY